MSRAQTAVRTLRCGLFTKSHLFPEPSFDKTVTGSMVNADTVVSFLALLMYLFYGKEKDCQSFRNSKSY